METKNKSKWGSGVYHFVSCYKFIYQNSAHDSCPTTTWGNRVTLINLSKSFPRRQWPKYSKYCETSVTTKEQASQGLSRSRKYLGDDTRTPSHLLCRIWGCTRGFGFQYFSFCPSSSSAGWSSLDESLLCETDHLSRGEARWWWAPAPKMKRFVIVKLCMCHFNVKSFRNFWHWIINKMETKSLQTCTKYSWDALLPNKMCSWTPVKSASHTVFFFFF